MFAETQNQAPRRKMGYLKKDVQESQRLKDEDNQKLIMELQMEKESQALKAEQARQAKKKISLDEMQKRRETNTELVGQLQNNGQERHRLVGLAEFLEAQDQRQQTRQAAWDKRLGTSCMGISLANSMQLCERTRRRTRVSNERKSRHGRRKVGKERRKMAFIIDRPAESILCVELHRERIRNCVRRNCLRWKAARSNLGLGEVMSLRVASSKTAGCLSSPADPAVSSPVVTFRCTSMRLQVGLLQVAYAFSMHPCILCGNDGVYVYASSLSSSNIVSIFLSRI